MAYSGAQVTRLGLIGIPRGLYGSFAGKAEAQAPAPAAAVTPTGGWLPRERLYYPRTETDEERRARVQAERERLGIVEALAAIPEPPRPSPRAHRAAQARHAARQRAADRERLRVYLEAVEAEQVALAVRRRRAVLLMLLLVD